MHSGSFLNLQFEYSGKSHREQLEDNLLELGALSINVSGEQIDNGRQVIDADWRTAHYSVILPLDSAITEMKRCLERFKCSKFEWRFISEKDWLRQSRSKQLWLKIGPFLISEKPVQTTDHIVPILLSGGLAFGTGEHATTAMCLDWLSQQSVKGKDVLDLGSGTGILAIAAKKLSASHVQAIDNDKDARRITRENASRNIVDIGIADVIDSAMQFDIVVSNILAGTLINLAPLVESALKPNGLLALSGLLTDQVASVQRAYEFIDFRTQTLSDDWVLISGFKSIT